MSTIKNFIFCDIQLSLKYIHTGQTEMLCSHLGNAYSILRLKVGVVSGYIGHAILFIQLTSVVSFAQKSYDGGMRFRYQLL